MRVVHVNRSRILLALLLVGLGSAVAVAGPDGVTHLGTLAADNVFIVVLLLAAASVFVTVMPRGTRVGPLVLTTLGLVAYVATHERWWSSTHWALAGLLIVLLGGGLALSGENGRRIDDFDPVRRVRAFGVPKSLDFRGEEWTPEHISAWVFGTKLIVDLREPGVAEGVCVELSLTCLWGYVELVLPDDWLVVGGRLALARGIGFSGRMDSSEIFSNPKAKEQRKKLERVVAMRGGDRDDDTGPAVVVIHVMGLGGYVSLAGRS
jgi:hypothetical protein